MIYLQKIIVAFLNCKMSDSETEIEQRKQIWSQEWEYKLAK